jgi:hypothetical protein
VTKAPSVVSSLGALVLYIVLALALFASAWVNPTYLSVGLAGDPQIHMWLLNWTPYSIAHGLNPFFTDYLNYPQGANLLWNLIPTVPGVLLSPSSLVMGPVFTYNLVMTLGIAGSAWCAYLAINSSVKDRLASLIGGLLFGFSPYMLAHSLGHPNLVISLTPPLTLLLLGELFVWQRRRAWLVGIGLGVLGAAQLLTTAEMLFATTLVGLIALAVLVVFRPGEAVQRLRHALPGLVSATIVFAVLGAAPLAYLFFGPERVVGVVREQDIYVTDLLNFVVPTHVMLLVPDQLAGLSRQWTGDDAEWNAYIGLPLLALLGFIALRWWRALLVRWSAIVAALIALLSLGPHLHLAGRIHFHIPLPWLLVQRLPLFENYLPARLMLFFYLFAGIALAFFVSHSRHQFSGWKLRAAWAWVAVSLLVLLPAVPWPATTNPIPPFFSGSSVDRIPAGSVALVAPFSTAPGFQLGPGQDSATNPMLWQVASGMRFRMPEGWVIVRDVDGNPTGGRPPRSTTQITMIQIQQGGTAPDLSSDLRAAILSDLARWHVSTVIVGPMYNQRAMLDFLTSLLGSEPEQVGGVYVWWDVGGRISPVAAR